MLIAKGTHCHHSDDTVAAENHIGLSSSSDNGQKTIHSSHEDDDCAICDFSIAKVLTHSVPTLQSFQVCTQAFYQADIQIHFIKYLILKTLRAPPVNC